MARIKTTARKDGDDYVINGGKMWTTNGTQADWMCLLANTGDGPGAQEQVADLRADEEQGRHGRAQAEARWACGPRDTAQIFFEDVRVPQRYRIGEEGMGFIYQMQQFQEERLWAAANPLQGLEKLHPARPSRTRGQRKAFGQAILDNQ